MLKSIGIILVAVVIVWLEVPTLLEKKYKKELIVFSILLLIGVGLSIALAFELAIPNPFDLLTYLLKPLNNLIKQ